MEILAAGDTDDPSLHSGAVSGTFYPLVVLIDRGSGDRKWALTYHDPYYYVKKAMFKPDASKIALFIGNTLD